MLNILQISQISITDNDSRKDAKLAKKTLCGLGVLARKIIFSCLSSLKLGLARLNTHYPVPIPQTYAEVF
jgi:hypothetical protein